MGDRGPRVRPRVILIIVACFGIGACGNSSTPSRNSPQRNTKPLHAGSFTTAFPATWHLSSKTSHGAHLYTLTTAGARVDALGIPTPGGIGITVQIVPSTTLPSRAKRALSHGATELVSKVVGVPKPRHLGEADVAAPPNHPRRTASGRRIVRLPTRDADNVQAGVVARHGGNVFFLEVDTESPHQREATAAFDTILRSWRW